MHEFRKIIAKHIAKSSKLNEEDIIGMLEQPKVFEHGDVAFPCFSLAKTLKKNPTEIAKEIASSIPSGQGIEKVNALGAYVNITLDARRVASDLAESLRAGTYGPKLSSHPEKVMIEFCQANTHKPFHIGHFRNICLGDSLVRLWRSGGHTVIAANYQGDIGAHVAKCLWGLTTLHKNKQPPAEHRGEWLGTIYAEANSKVEEDETNKEAVSQVLQKLESGDLELNTLWKQTRKWCIDEYDEYYSLIGVKFDRFFFESEVEKPGKEIVKKLESKGIAKKDNGAVIVDLQEHNLGVFVILKSDGTSLYSTKDLALAARKFEEFGIERSVYVVGSEQKFYFQQLFKTLQLMGFKHASLCFHLSYELVTLPEGKMSSRSGNVVTFREVYHDVHTNAINEVKKRHKDWGSKKVEHTAKVITLAGLRFSMLDQDNNKTIVFSKEKALDFEGETGPYVLYVIARINSVFRKGQARDPSHLDAKLLKEPSEFRLVKLLAHFGEVVEKATREYRPLLLAKYLIEVAQSFNEFYNACPILTGDTRQARLWLSSATRSILQDGLNLLGISFVEEM